MRAVAPLLAIAFVLLTARVRAADPTHHMVVRKDTLSGIGKTHGISVDELRRLNDIDGDTIVVGQRLRLRGPTPTTTYRVRKGDTLGHIARRQGVTVKAILALNAKLNPRRLRVGQKITVPLRAKSKREQVRKKKALACPGRVVPIANHAAFRVRNRAFAWTTSLTADAVDRGFDHIRIHHGSRMRARILDASRRRLGPLGHHLSHRTGSDVDITYFQKKCGPAGCPMIPVTPSKLDVTRQWSLMRYWIEQDDVALMFVDYALQKRLYAEAKKTGATRSELARWFQYPRPATVPHGIIRHWKGHRNHVHVRFRATTPVASCPKPVRRTARRKKKTKRAKPRA